MGDAEETDDENELFNYILARSRARESSTLTVATVAASASLIFLALYIQAQTEADTATEQTSLGKYRVLIIMCGILFGSLGIAYREITKKGIHARDERYLRNYLNFTEVEGDAREGILCILLVIPIIAWIAVIILGLV